MAITIGILKAILETAAILFIMDVSIWYLVKYKYKRDLKKYKERKE